MSILTWLIILKIILVIVITGSLIFFFLAACSIYTNLISGVPWAKIPEENISLIFKEINLPPNALIYDLGCGDGRVLFIAEKYGCRATGYELSFYPYLKAWLKKFIFQSAVKLKRRDFFKANLSPADAVFIFLVGKVMGSVGRKLGLELKKGAVAVSYGFPIPGWQTEKVIFTKPSLTYVYKV